MSGPENWRTEVDASDYFGNRQKKLNVADRRPVIRRASDLVGPGIDVNSLRVDNLNNPLATYNGFYSYKSVADVGNPTADTDSGAPTDGDDYVGTISSDAEIGGIQTFTNITTEVVYQRVFRRSPGDASFIYWGAWKVISV